MRFTRFGVRLGNTVNCDTLAPQRKHEKTLDFYTDYPLFCILDVFLICFLIYFSTVKRVISNHTNAQTQTLVCGSQAAHRRPASIFYSTSRQIRRLLVNMCTSSMSTLSQRRKQPQSTATNTHCIHNLHPLRRERRCVTHGLLVHKRDLIHQAVA